MPAIKQANKGVRIMRNAKLSSYKNSEGNVETRIEARDASQLFNSMAYRVFFSVSAVDGSKSIAVVQHAYDDDLTRIMKKPFYRLSGSVTKYPVAEGWTKKEVIENIVSRINY